MRWGSKGWKNTTCCFLSWLFWEDLRFITSKKSVVPHVLGKIYTSSSEQIKKNKPTAENKNNIGTCVSLEFTFWKDAWKKKHQALENVRKIPKGRNRLPTIMAFRGDLVLRKERDSFWLFLVRVELRCPIKSWICSWWESDIDNGLVIYRSTNWKIAKIRKISSHKRQSNSWDSRIWVWADFDGWMVFFHFFSNLCWILGPSRWILGPSRWILGPSHLPLLKKQLLNLQVFNDWCLPLKPSGFFWSPMVISVQPKLRTVKKAVFFDHPLQDGPQKPVINGDERSYFPISRGFFDPS